MYFSFYIAEAIDKNILSYMTAANIQQLFNKYGLQLGVQFHFESWLKSWQNSNSSAKKITSEPKDSFVSSCNYSGVNFEIEHILKLSSQGRTILDLFTKNQQLNDGSRAIIVELVVNFMIQNEIKMTTDVAQKIADNIVKIFPSEFKVIFVY